MMMKMMMLMEMVVIIVNEGYDDGVVMIIHLTAPLGNSQILLTIVFYYTSIDITVEMQKEVFIAMAVS